jgi:hypothetical protein
MPSWTRWAAVEPPVTCAPPWVRHGWKSIVAQVSPSRRIVSQSGLMSNSRFDLDLSARTSLTTANGAAHSKPHAIFPRRSRISS